MAEETKVQNLILSYIDSTEVKQINLFWIGVILYTLGTTVSTTQTVNVVFCNAFQIIGAVLFTYGAVKLIRSDVDNDYLKTIFFILCFWFFIVIARGISFDYGSIKRFLFEPYNVIFIYLVPLVLLFPQNLFYYKKVFDVILISCVLFLIFCVVFSGKLVDRDDLLGKYAVDYFARNLSLTSLFIILTYPYHSTPKKLIALATILLTLALAVYRARRGLTVLVLVPLAFSYLIYAFNVRNITNIIFSVIVVTGISLFIFIQFNDDDSPLFSAFKDRLTEDSRGSVEDCYYSDMKTIDWIIGRGMNGVYYCPLDIDEGNSATHTRDLIEADFLTIILKGGIISIALMLLIAVPAIIKGLFYSHNVLSKGAAIWILLWIIGMYPSTVVVFTVNYLVVWVCIGICYSRTIRAIPESILKQYFKPAGVYES